ncbi:uncharacterized protein TNCV_4291912 [Trichonephila clavipes]|uniref:Uncharacterized protein n=1 Tax=Trichonephila clavipes TaxID=2585209 RepID=A0A8X6RMB6_TRICX|nr:uncharacterized protein TNCV_4291912 [Trichonephila clavipes]
MITNFFIPELNNHDVQELWFQQCHTARATIDLLKDTFGDRLISRFGPVNWPPRSCDLTPLDYFMWGYVKLLVYADKPQTLDHLEDNIRRVIADIRPQMLQKVIENWTSRLDYIRASRGSPMPQIIFKMVFGMIGSVSLSSSYIWFMGGVGVSRGVKGCRGNVQNKITAQYFKGADVTARVDHIQKEADSKRHSRIESLIVKLYLKYYPHFLIVVESDKN